MAGTAGLACCTAHRCFRIIELLYGICAAGDACAEHIGAFPDNRLCCALAYVAQAHIGEAHGSKASSKIFVIENLDDLKARLAKVILMILIVTLFEQALKMKKDSPLDLLYLGGSIALIGLALYFTHAAESHGAERAETKHGKD